ncbi:acyl carrier protein [Catellatospora sp. NPDC049133]|jgi:acyl carrier protein|uniref:acyl carrier protein n=1 Tax=Catellatospora sp. NPDC049133 TaxID=3155499 RepID=UPI0033D4A08B
MDSAQTPAGGVAGDLVGAIADMLDRDAASISPETRFFDDLGFDSTSILVLLTQIETKVGFEFDPDELEPQDLETVGALISFVDRQVGS